MSEALVSFLKMGGYAAFVWPSYALALLVLVGLLVSSLRGLRMAERKLEAAGSRRDRRASRSAPPDGAAEPQS